MIFRSEMKVRFGDIDRAGIVYYPRFANYVHASLEDFFDDYLEVGYSHFLDDLRLGLPTVHLEMDFIRPVRFGDRLLVGVEVVKLGKTSIVWRHQLFRKGEPEPLAVGRITTVLVDMDSMKKLVLPEWFRSSLERYQAQCQD